jgi:hypothetical protein
MDMEKILKASDNSQYGLGMRKISEQKQSKGHHSNLPEMEMTINTSKYCK